MASETSSKRARKRAPEQSWPEHGDQDEDDLYRAVGRALSQWGHVEGAFARLFSALIALDRDSNTARRAYGAVRTSEARLSMIRAAYGCYLHYFPDPELEQELCKVTGEAQRLVGSRNEVAHGVVSRFYSAEDEPFVVRQEFALYPSFEDSSKRNVVETPYFCYTSSRIQKFEAEFASLVPKVAEVTRKIIDKARTLR